MTDKDNVDPDELDERAEEVQDCGFVTFEEHADRGEYAVFICALR